MQNIREPRSIPFSMLVPQDIQVLPNVLEIPEAIKDLAQDFGAENMYSEVVFTAELGTIIYDIYQAVAERPKAPLRQERENARRQRLAEELSQDEFELPDDVKAVVEKALDSDSIWESISLSFSYFSQTRQATEHFPLSSNALGLYAEVRKALLALFA